MFVRSAEASGVKWLLRVCETVLPCLLLFFFTSTALQAMEPSEQQAAQSRLEEAFKKLDLDGNQQLTEEEYLAQAGDQKVLKRDFLIFDLDEDGSLSLVEFSLTPGVIPAKYRVGIADPIDLYRDNAKKMFHEWAKPQLQGKATRGESFSGTSPGYAPSSVVQFFNGSPNQFPPIGSVSANQHFKYFDKDSDGVLSPEELENFLDIMVGKRMLSGFLFRHENGLVVRYGNFIRHDQNRDGKITLEEFLALNPQENAKEEFQQADTNQNGSLSLGEFSVVPGLGLADPIADFRAADEDLDGFLSAKELKKSLPEAMHDLIPHTFHAYAQNQPGKLSLSEYRLSPFGNDITVWEARPITPGRTS